MICCLSAGMPIPESETEKRSTSAARFSSSLSGLQPPAAGSTVSVNLAAANRDPARYENPDSFDLFRPPKPHMAFAFGAHRCLGMHLARMETTVVMNAILDRLPDLRLDPDAGEVAITGATFRSPLAIPVCFAAS